jgi:hypothetical protein
MINVDFDFYNLNDDVDQYVKVESIRAGAYALAELPLSASSART